MTPVTPIRQPPAEDLRNAIQTAMLYQEEGTEAEARDALRRVRALMLSALDKFGEPNPATLEVTKGILSGALGVTADDQQVWEVAAVVTRTALTWETPRVW